MNELFPQPGLVARDPDQRVAISGVVRNIDVHVKGLLFGDNAGIDRRQGGQFIPKKFFVGPLADVLRSGRAGLRDLLDHGFGHVSFHGNVDGGHGDLVPRRPQDDMHRLGIPPKIEFAAIGGRPSQSRDGGDASTHDHQFLSQFRHLRIEADGLGQVGERPARINGHFARILVDHPDDEMRRVLLFRPQRRISFWQIRNFKGAVIQARVPGSGVDASGWRVNLLLIPRALIADHTVQFLPASDLFFAVDQGEDGAGINFHVLMPGQFKHAQSVCDFLVAPLVSADDGYSESLDLWGLEHDEKGLLVGSRRSTRVLIEDHFPAILPRTGQHHDEKEQQRTPNRVTHARPPGPQHGFVEGEYFYRRSEYGSNMEKKGGQTGAETVGEELFLFFLILDFADAYDFRGSAKFLVIAICLFHSDVEVLDQGQSNVDLHRKVEREPDFVVDSRLLQHETRTLVKAREKQSPGNRIEAFDFHFRQLQVILVDPYAPVKFRKEPGLLHVRFKTGAGFAIDHPGF